MFFILKNTIMKTKFYIKGIKEIQVITDVSLSSNGISKSEEWIICDFDVFVHNGFDTEIEAIEFIKNELIPDEEKKRNGNITIGSEDFIRFEITKGYTI